MRLLRPLAAATLTGGLVLSGCESAPRGAPAFVDDPVAFVDPLIGTANGGNTFPGAVVPFGMVAWSPETTTGDPTRRPAPGGYRFDATRIRGFSLTHLSGTGCRGASGEVPILPMAGRVVMSPSADSTDRAFATAFEHANERAEAGYYRVRLRDGVGVELSATTRTGVGRFSFPPAAPATILFRVSDSEVGSSEAEVRVDAEAGVVSGRVSSGNFCGYIDPVIRHSYYTLYFVAELDRPVTGTGVWEDGEPTPGGIEASGGTGWDDGGYPVLGRGSGAWVEVDPGADGSVGLRVGISYVSLENARENLEAEAPRGTTVDAVRERARELWRDRLGRIRVAGGSPTEHRTFYTALYHSLLHPNVFSDVNGEYPGFDGAVHDLREGQAAQYANFSGWDVYRSQVQLVTLLDPTVGSDIVQSLYHQAAQNDGVWDRWTHNSGPTAVMEGDASTMAVASIHAFGGTGFDVEGVYESLTRAARVPTELDLSDEGCPVMCPGQRPSLDQWLSIGYVPAGGNAWGGAGETLEDVSADFALAQLAAAVGDSAAHDEFLERSENWRNIFDPEATEHGGYIRDRRADGTWTPFDPESSRGFAEGSSAQYTWMIPFDARGLIDAMGGDSAAVTRLDGFFRMADGGWALTGLGGLKAEMDNEPSIGAPWMYLFAGRPDRAQETLREILDRLWDDTPHGIPGNDDLGAMSSWYVWTAIGLYPFYPGRAELLVTAPAFERVEVRRGDRTVLRIEAPGADSLPYVRAATVDGEAWTRSWLPETFVEGGGAMRFELAAEPEGAWGRAEAERPPSWGAGGVMGRLGR